MNNRLINILTLVMIVSYILVNLALLFVNSIPTNYIRYIFVILFYMSIAILIWFNVKNISIFHMDRMTLVFIILFGIFRSRLDIQNEGYFKSIILLFTVLILIAYFKNRRYVPKTGWRWTGIGLLSCLLGIPIALLESFQPDVFASIKIPPGGLNLVLAQRVFYNLSFVVLMEETLFRGFLWGFLQNHGWKENRIFWGQAILFWAIHFWNIVNPITFFLTIPIGIMVQSLLVRYSKQLFPSVLFHLILNSIGPFIVYFFFLH
jgi:membrane protease YdiL (CAAX protease family)